MLGQVRTTGPEIPAAEFIVNPNLPNESFPSKNLCGVGVVFYVLAALGRVLAERGVIDTDRGRAIVTHGLDLVALGTVADLVPLDYNNRILVAEGVRRMRAGRTRPGIRALFDVAGRTIASARSSDLGFGIAPRLNAAGRLTDMSLGNKLKIMETKTEEIKRLYLALPTNGGKTAFTIKVAQKLKMKPGSVKNALLGGFWEISQERQIIIFKMLKEEFE